MYRIAVCDGTSESAGELACRLRELSEEMMWETAVDRYGSYEKLRDVMRSVKYDLICLDTTIGESCGLDFARELRAEGDKTDLIFVASDAKYALAAYSVFPVGYLLKPASAEKLRPFFRAATEKRRSIPALLFRLMAGGEVAVDQDDILYIEVFGTELDVHCRKEVYVCNGSLADTYSMLPERQFYRSHRSFIVNLKYVTKMSKYQFAMVNGDKVTIAKNRYAEAKEILRAFIGER